MLAPKTDPTNLLRTLLVLGRVSNLPTVWSNCLAGWLLGGGGRLSTLLLLCFGTTLLYIGGMYLNDACDAQFDAQHRRERPIPSGAIAWETVWQLSLLWLVVGTLALLPFGRMTSYLGLLLVICIVVYDLVHKWITFSPLLMAACRFFLYLVAASCAKNGVTGLALWSAFAMAGYIVGLSYLARKESTNTAYRYWPILLLAMPILLALVVNGTGYLKAALVVSTLLGLWIIRCLRHTLWTASPNIGRTVSGLLAGIVLVDLLAVADQPPLIGSVFLILFAAALLFQRFIPAT